jgi:UrcA family protein
MITPLSMTSQKRSWISRAGFAALLAPVVLSGALPASAKAADTFREVTVRYGDLDLTRQEGATVLYRRLHNAARTVCGANEMHEIRDLRRLHMQRECYERVLSGAVQKVDHPILAALHRARWRNARSA